MKVKNRRNKNIPSLPLPAARIKPISDGRPRDTRYTASLPHQTPPLSGENTAFQSQCQKTYLQTCASGKDSDQPDYSSSLIKIFTGCILESQG